MSDVIRQKSGGLVLKMWLLASLTQFVAACTPVIKSLNNSVISEDLASNFVSDVEEDIEVVRITNGMGLGLERDDAPVYFNVVNDIAYFAAYNEDGYRKLFKHDGITLTQVSDTHTNNDDFASGNPDPILLDGLVYFKANLSVGPTETQIFSYDGSNVVQIDSSSTFQQGMKSGVDNSLYIQLSTNMTSGIYKFKDGIFNLVINGINLYPVDSSTSVLYYMNQSDNTLHAESDGDFTNFPGVTSSFIFAEEGAMYFTSYDGMTNDLYIWDEVSSTKIPGTVNSAKTVFKWNNNTYAVLVGADFDQNIYHLNTDTLALTQVSDTYPGHLNNIEANDILSTDDLLYFVSAVGDDGMNYYKKLFTYDGVSVSQITDLNPGGSDQLQCLTQVGDDIYFSAYNGTANKLYKTDGTTVTQVVDLNPDANDFNIGSCQLMVTTKYIYFSGIVDGVSATQVFAITR